MKINPDINYESAKEVRKLLSDIELAIKENGIKKVNMCDSIGMHKTVYSQFAKGAKYQVSEERCRKVVEYINKRHLD